MIAPQNMYTPISVGVNAINDAGLLRRCVPEKHSSTYYYSISSCWYDLGQPIELPARCRKDILGSVAVRVASVSWTCFAVAHETNNLYASLLQQRHRGWTLGHSTHGQITGTGMEWRKGTCAEFGDKLCFSLMLTGDVRYKYWRH